MFFHRFGRVLQVPKENQKHPTSLRTAEKRGLSPKAKIEDDAMKELLELSLCQEASVSYAVKILEDNLHFSVFFLFPRHPAF